MQNTTGWQGYQQTTCNYPQSQITVPFYFEAVGTIGTFHAKLLINGSYNLIPEFLVDRFDFTLYYLLQICIKGLLWYGDSS